MKILRITLKLSALAVFAAVLSAPVRAQATRTWVSGVGDDSNPCSRTSPCRTWQGALPKTANGGEINALDPGSFGTVLIKKPVTLDGGGEFAGVTVSSGVGITIDIPPGDNSPPRSVSLRHMAINGLGAGAGAVGVRVVQAESVFIEDVVIHDFSEQGVDVNAAAEVSLSLTDVQIRKCSTGVKVQTSSGFVYASLNDVSVQRCAVGVEGGAHTRVGVRDSVFARNPTGIKTTGSTSIVNVENTFVTFSQTVGLIASTGSTIRVSSSTVTQNATGIKANGGQMVSLGLNTVFGNTVDGTFTATNQKK